MPTSLLRSPNSLPRPEQGSPVFWHLPQSQQRVEIALVDYSDQGAASRWSRFLVLAAVLLIFLSYVPRGLTYLAGLWPEICTLMGLAGMFAWGVSFIGVLLVAVGSISRLIWVARVAHGFVITLFRPAHTPESQ